MRSSKYHFLVSNKMDETCSTLASCGNCPPVGNFTPLLCPKNQCRRMDRLSVWQSSWIISTSWVEVPCTTNSAMLMQTEQVCGSLPKIFDWRNTWCYCAAGLLSMFLFLFWRFQLDSLRVTFFITIYLLKIGFILGLLGNLTENAFVYKLALLSDEQWF